MMTMWKEGLKALLQVLLGFVLVVSLLCFSIRLAFYCHYQYCDVPEHLAEYLECQGVPQEEIQSVEYGLPKSGGYFITYRFAGDSEHYYEYHHDSYTSKSDGQAYYRLCCTVYTNRHVSVDDYEAVVYPPLNDKMYWLK